MVNQLIFQKNRILWLAIAALPLIAFITFNPDYLILDTFTWVGVALLPFTFKVNTELKNQRFFWAALAAGAFSIVFPSTFGMFCIAIFMTLMIVEAIYGQLSLLTAFHLLLLSPLFKYFSSLISFPLRLQVSEVVAGLMNVAGLSVKISGNVIEYAGTEFLVDKACMGLHMLGYSFLFGIAILAYFEKKGIGLSLFKILALFALLLTLNLTGNVIRATILILFKIMPDNPTHDIVGLMTLAMYVLLPFYSVNRLMKPSMNKVSKSNSISKIHWHVQLAVVTVLYTFTIYRGHTPEQSTSEVITIAGFKSQVVSDNVTKLTSSEALVYIKPPVPAYKADHNPLICWRGSGYSFKKIDRLNVDGNELYSAELVKKSDKLYTAWWFQAGDQHIAVDQWSWRWNSIKDGHAYSMINVTAANRELLIKNCKKLLNTSNTITLKTP